MKHLQELIIFVLFVLGGGGSLAGTQWYKYKKGKKDVNEHQSSKQQNQSSQLTARQTATPAIDNLACSRIQAAEVRQQRRLPPLTS